MNARRQRIIAECNLLGENRDLLRRSVQRMRSHGDTYVQRGGGSVEESLQRFKKNNFSFV